MIIIITTIIIIIIIIINYYCYIICTHVYIYIYILITTQLGFLSRVLFNRGSHMFIFREGPTQSSIAKHFFGECEC